MTALPLEPHTEAEEATLKRIEGAEPAEESAVEKVARALYAAEDGYRRLIAGPNCHEAYRRLATAAIGAMKGPSPAEAALARVEAVCAGAGPARYFWEPRTVTVDSVRTAIAAPVAQAGEGR